MTPTPTRVRLPLDVYAAVRTLAEERGTGVGAYLTRCATMDIGNLKILEDDLTALHGTRPNSAKAISIRISPEDLAKIDALRGDHPRITWIALVTRARLRAARKL